MGRDVTEPRHAIAVDAGGSSTRAVLVDARGTVLAEARGGPGNPRAVGRDAAARTITDACVTAAAAAEARVEALVVSAAGVLSMGGKFPELADALTAAGLGAPLVLEPDLVSAFFSATAEPDGAVLIVGTGTTAARITDARVVEVRDGLGWLLGDDGSGFWIGRQVARAVAAHLDGRGPETSLVDSVLALVGARGSSSPPRDPRLAGLVDWAYGAEPVTLASLAVLAAREAGRGDALANQICDEAAGLILATLRCLPLEPGGPVAVGGSVLGPGSPVGRRVLAQLPGALRVSDGVVGAALLAVRALGGPADDATHTLLRDSLSVVRG